MGEIKAEAIAPAFKKAVKSSGHRKAPAWLTKQEKTIEQRLTKVRSQIICITLAGKSLPNYFKR
ncbi:MAG: hypothetical protein DRQ64_06240 [Gammaproteobacteria bacterium]|nr:MAG: hypothetical protein DRQ64_06240 [Gammaproteobacteria bacterium]